MSIQAKEFDNCHNPDVIDEINEFIADKDVIDIKLCANPINEDDSYNTYLVIYRENTVSGKNLIDDIRDTMQSDLQKAIRIEPSMKLSKPNKLEKGGVNRSE
ncbi:hypothetical protein [Listeria ilorinensis]|uniref:hypothetical protein n=1 Tax=Listeria ilorinensis TaxID=2867439 RepID=UPI001EF44553|nr:hypothetical protein [Listeria ilorinensis]